MGVKFSEMLSEIYKLISPREVKQNDKTNALTINVSDSNKQTDMHFAFMLVSHSPEKQV